MFSLALFACDRQTDRRNMALRNADMVFQVQTWKDLLLQKSDPAHHFEWSENELLQKTVNHFLLILPRSGTRAAFLMHAVEYVETHPSDPKQWLAYFTRPSFFDQLLPCMEGYAAAGERIEPLIEAFPLPTVPADVMAAALAVKENMKYQTPEQREAALRKEADALDEKAFGKKLSKSERESNQFVCRKCGVKGLMESQTMQTRLGADEAPTDKELCKACRKGSRTSG
jgi:DNA-directed RNA polymerase subunit M/transcription elongation factor TFIIS